VPNFLARREAGFTLLEVIVVMVLVTIISSVSILSMAFYIPNVRLKSVAQDINIQVQKARLEAIRQSRHCYVEFFRTVDGETFSPFIWMELEDEDGDSSDDAVYEPTDNDADGIVDTVVYALPVSLVDGEWELKSPRGIRFDATFGDADGVTFPASPVLPAPVKRFHINSRGISNSSGSVYLVNARGKNKEIMVTLGGAVRVF
jgi:prepilin-type N-terminal cleavage/methylation domain-containing protein